MTAHHKTKYQSGVTLIELIITIVIISVALTGIMGVVNITAKHSADPVAQQQVIAIAESYLEEILLLPNADPDGTNAGETRDTFDNIDDYDGLSDTGVKDQHGTAISNLSNYSVSVDITNTTISGVVMKAITVNVTRASNTISLTGYRANY